MKTRCETPLSLTTPFRFGLLIPICLFATPSLQGLVRAFDFLCIIFLIPAPLSLVNLT